MLRINDRPLPAILAEKQHAKGGYIRPDEVETESQVIPTESDAQKQRRKRADVRAFTIRGFCEAYSISRSRVYELIGDGSIEARKNGKRTIITAVEAERWLASLPKMGGRHDE